MKGLQSNSSQSRLPDLAPKWVRLAPNGTNPGIFQIRFSTFWAQIWSPSIVLVLEDYITVLPCISHVRCQIYPPVGPDCHQMGQIWDFFKIFLKCTRFVPFHGNMAELEARSDIPALYDEMLDLT